MQLNTNGSQIKKGRPCLGFDVISNQNTPGSVWVSSTMDGGGCYFSVCHKKMQKKLFSLFLYIEYIYI